ncbi:hypothetical protein KIL84_004315 [Mauremys mutica]|uniref:Uncharacterized protein n=1 Tax=Mauremys mutica TaxID=74926 RepID=A0A9D3XMU2_9SAUR|nr:hypothetical protein KIL84_004315 [Mauremys mutica]
MGHSSSKVKCYNLLLKVSLSESSGDIAGPGWSGAGGGGVCESLGYRVCQNQSEWQRRAKDLGRKGRGSLRRRCSRVALGLGLQDTLEKALRAGCLGTRPVPS